MLNLLLNCGIQDWKVCNQLLKLVIAKMADDINGVFTFKNTQLTFRVTQKTKRNKCAEEVLTAVKMCVDYL